jgi:ubiquinone/menaquinone biosynthesis C-methylase UbiE
MVFCSNCIDHTNDPSRSIAEIQRVLKPVGHFALTCEVFAADRGVRDHAHPYSMTLSKLLRLVKAFSLTAHWESPWIGLRNYVLDQPGTAQREHILLLRKHERQ